MTNRSEPRSSSARDAGYRAIPSVDAVLQVLAGEEWPLDPALTTAIVADCLDVARRRIAAGAPLTRDEIMQSVRDRLAKLLAPRLTRVLNGTGIIIHTNLGRSPVSATAARAMAEAAASAVPLEIEPDSNERGGRLCEISDLLRVLAGAEATLVVNNNAAAVLLVLAALAPGREVIVSRGEAVEIGDGFRIPDVLARSGATLVEVGTTNRTYTRDYLAAIGPETAAILKVHPSNFRMTGFTATPAIEDLVAAGADAGIPVIEDLGSGALLDTARFGLTHEPIMRERLDAGVAVVMASGDKLLGGPQAGIIAGKQDLVELITSHPLARAVRADKTTLAGLAATLRHYLRGEAADQIPVWRMVAADCDGLGLRAGAVAQALAGVPLTIAVNETRASVGGGSLPGEDLPSVGLRITLSGGGMAPDDLARALRTHRPTALYARVHDGAVIVDLRTIVPEDDADLITVLTEVARAASAGVSSRGTRREPRYPA